jgi:hypothetical protein
VLAAIHEADAQLGSDTGDGYDVREFVNLSLPKVVGGRMKDGIKKSLGQESSRTAAPHPCSDPLA